MFKIRFDNILAYTRKSSIEWQDRDSPLHIFISQISVNGRQEGMDELLQKLYVYVCSTQPVADCAKLVR